MAANDRVQIEACPIVPVGRRAANTPEGRCAKGLYYAAVKLNLMKRRSKVVVLEIGVYARDGELPVPRLSREFAATARGLPCADTCPGEPLKAAFQLTCFFVCCHKQIEEAPVSKIAVRMVIGAAIVGFQPSVGDVTARAADAGQDLTPAAPHRVS